MQDRIRDSRRRAVSSPYGEGDIDICSSATTFKDAGERGKGETSRRCDLRAGLGEVTSRLCLRLTLLGCK